MTNVIKETSSQPTTESKLLCTCSSSLNLHVNVANIDVTKPLVTKCFRLLRSNEQISSNFSKAPVTGKPGHHQVIDGEIFPFAPS